MMPLCGNLIFWKDICITGGGVNMNCHQDNGLTLRKYVKSKIPIFGILLKIRCGLRIWWFVWLYDLLL